MFPTIIIRHRKENLKKCSLSGLEKNKDFLFFTYPSKMPLFDPINYIVLAMDGSPLSKEDENKGILLIDATWNYSKKMLNCLPKTLEKRSLPKCYQTAYPRKQTGCTDPAFGLASIEALFVAYQILDRENDHILNHYYWKKDFLAKNNLNEGFILT